MKKLFLLFALLPIRLVAQCPSTLPVQNGGTGQSNLPAHCILIGEGTQPTATACPSAANDILTDNGLGQDPSFHNSLQLPSIEGVFYADQQAGATVTNKLDNCLSATGNLCVAPAGMASGSPTSYPNGKILWDQRATTGLNLSPASLWIMTSTGDFLDPFRFEMGLNPSANSTANQFGLQNESFIYAGNTKNFSGQQTGVYGSFSHFGSGNLATISGGGFEAFNPGSATATSVIGVTGNGWNGGVSGGIPNQTATNNGNTTFLVGGKFFAGNVSTGTVGNAYSLRAESITNTGGGAVTNATGLLILDQTAGTNNFGIQTGLGFNTFGDVVKVTGNTNLPASTPGVGLYLAAGSNPVAGRIFFSDGTGWQLRFAKRSGSSTTDLFTFLDTGELDLTSVGTVSLRINGGSSIGLKQRIQNSSTGSIGATTRTEVLVSWPTTMGDTNYTVTCSVQDSTTAAATQGLTFERLRTKSATQVGLVINNPTAGAITGSIDCMGEHQ